MPIVKIVPMPGPQGPGGSGEGGDIADFTFSVETFDGEFTESKMTVANHDMKITTTRDDGQDADIDIESADDIWITANDTIEITSTTDEVRVITGEDGQNEWKFTQDGTIEFPDGTIQTTAYVAPSNEVVIPLPEFLDYAEGRDQLPVRNRNFGWDSDGVWFGPTSDNGNGDSYPIFTSFTIPSDTPVQVYFDAEVDAECSDIGVALYVDGTIPQWEFGTNVTRIAAQYNCPGPELAGLTTTSTGDGGLLPGPGIYRYAISYNPLSDGSKVLFTVFDQNNGAAVVSFLELDERLPEGDYRIGFAADYDSEEGADADKSYIRNLEILVNPGEGQTVYEDSLTNGNSGSTNYLDLTVPVNILDSEGNNLITFEKSYTGTARIVAPQDDLALRSARDILLYAGEDGPGNVYIGWGDAEMTPDSNNRVATIGDIQDATTGDITFDGVQIIGAGTASGDGNNYGTIELVPDASRYEYDQYLIIDPTVPNHIHIRAGGEQDNSSAELILGAENNNVKVSDNYGVVINTVSTPTETTLTNQAEEPGVGLIAFVQDYELPSIGDTIMDNFVTYTVTEIDYVTGIEGQKIVYCDGLTFEPGLNYTFTSQSFSSDWAFSSDGTLNLSRSGIIANNNGDIILDADDNVYIGNSDTPDNQIATIGDLPTGATGSFVSNDNKTITVTNGIITAIEDIL